ncbi:HEAT repeat domain-containing protein [Mycoavidus sp. B2-EB]|uniref:HEAT repeat domain-containing protein n=1 Tax=Mycoavidus sp. B2-EB TaxID=2651972 RepID=UPI001624DB5C|nr:HEAT repeat domain-containing protein [Mycoavidus sp. B2-EB]BBO59749.1 hypothetical protein MPB2EB_0874 [Mycoavidus sp. B2-EB]
MEIGPVSNSNFGITRGAPQSAADFHKKALEYEKQGEVDKAQTCYQQALRVAEKLNSTEPAVSQTLARIHLDYAGLLKNQRNIMAGNAYRQAQRYALEAYRLGPNQADVQVLLQSIGLCHSQYLSAQGQSAQSEQVFQETVQWVKENLSEHKASSDRFLPPTNDSASAAHRSNLSPDALPFSIQAGHPAGKTVFQYCQGTVNAPVQGRDNTVNIYYNSQSNTVPLEGLRNALYKYYELSSLSIRRVSGETASLKDCYINLAIVESQAQREKDKQELEKQVVTFNRLPSSERQRLEATNPNKLIELDKLFEKQKLRDGSEGIPKRILIQGRAGIGKTTLCKKLVYDYQNGGLWQDQFDCVLWIPLRQLKTHAPKRLEDLLCTQYFAGYEMSQAQALSKAFYTHQAKTLFILDGLDEVIEELNEGAPLKDLLQTLLDQAHVVITSRPAGVDVRLLGQLDLELETVGFSPANVQAYIEKFVPESNQASIQQFIHQTLLIQGLVNIPIQLDALCYSWDKLPPQQEITMSMLYEAMVDKLWRKDGVRLAKEDQKSKVLKANVIQISSKEKLEELMKDEIDYLGYLAFKGLEEGKIEFNLKELDQCQAELENEFLGKKLLFSFTDNLKKTSYLHTAEGYRPESERQYHFLHLTFQEFFAAKFLVRHLEAYSGNGGASTLGQSERTNESLMLSEDALHTFMAGHKYNPRYEIVWWMVAGLLKGVPLEEFFTGLEQSPRDLIGGRHQQVLMGCLNEARSRLNPEVVRGLEKELMKWLDFGVRLGNSGALGQQRAFPEHLLLTLLDQPDNRKSKVIETLGARPTLSEAAVQSLIRALQDEDAYIRFEAARALEGQSALSEAAEQALIRALQNQDKSILSAVVSALGGQSTLSDAVVQALIRALQNQDKDVRDAAARALGGQSTLSYTAVQALIDTLQHQEWDIRFAAAMALRGKSTLSEAAMQALIGALQHQNGNVRFAAAMALRGKGKLSEAAVQALIGALQDQKRDVRFAAAGALEGQSTLSDATEQALICALQDQDQDESLRSAAAMALRGQSTLSEAAVQALIGALQGQDKDVRFAAAGALEGQSTLSDATEQALICALQDQDQDESLRSAAAMALRGKSTLSEAAVQALIGALQGQDKDVRSAAASALGGQSTLFEAAEQALIHALQHQDMDVMDAAASALGGQSTLSDAAEQALICALQGQDKSIRSAAAWALRNRSTLSEAAVQALICALQDQNKDIRFVAEKALDRQNTLSEAAVRALISTLQHQEWNVRSAAANALRGKSTLSEAAVQALISALQNESETVRSAAAWALEGQSTLSEATVQALIGALQHQDGYRGAARALVQHIDVIYAVLPGLSRCQIERLYTECLFNYSCEHIAPLYVQGDRLHFYTEKGPGQTARIEQAKLEKIIQAFEAVQIKEGMIPMPSVSRHISYWVKRNFSLY